MKLAFNLKYNSGAQRTKIKDARLGQILKAQVSLGYNPSSWYSTLRHPVEANAHGAHLGWPVVIVVHFTKWLCPLHNPSCVKKREILGKLLHTKKQRTTSSGDQMRILGKKVSGIFTKWNEDSFRYYTYSKSHFLSFTEIVNINF